MAEFNLDNTHWVRLRGFVSELRIDSRWILRNDDDDKPYGSLRIVSHPDLQPGYLRAFFNYVTSVSVKSNEEKIQTVEDYDVQLIELEIYSIDNTIKTENKTFEAPYKELEELFAVKIFE